MPRHWFIKTKSGKAGPVTSKMLIRLASEGKIQPNSGVSPDGQEWLKAKTVAGLSFPDSRPDERWLLKTKAGNAGPFTLKKLQKLAREGRVRPDFAVSRDGQQWIKAKLVPGIQFPATEEPVPGRSDDEPPQQPAIQEEPASVQPPQREVVKPTPVDPRRTEWAQQREAEYVSRFGPYSEVSREPSSQDPAIDVYLHPATAQRPVTTLVTSGMSDRAMPMPTGVNSPRVELILYVDQPHPTYVDMLRYLAHLAHQQEMQLSYGSLVDNGNPPRPIFPGSVLEGYLFMIPSISIDFDIQESLSIDGDPLQVLWVVPITRAERQFISEHGMRLFCELLDQNNHSILINPARGCYASAHRGAVG